MEHLTVCGVFAFRISTEPTLLIILYSPSGKNALLQSHVPYKENSKQLPDRTTQNGRKTSLFVTTGCEVKKPTKR